MKIKFNTDDNIPLNEIIYLPTITIAIRSITKKIMNLSTSLLRRMFVSNIKMLEYDRIDISEDIDTNKTSALKECNICCY